VKSELEEIKLGTATISQARKHRNKGGNPPRKFFAPVEKYVGHSLKVLDIV